MAVKVDVESIRELYPFKSNYLDTGAGSLHYVDEGEGDPILMVHGNPTWSFYYRGLANAFKGANRVVIPDHMGCGLSDLPDGYEYTLENRINDLTTLVKFLDLKNITLIVHDWGGAIGFGLATRYPELIKKIVILNTAAFVSERIPFRISLCKNKFFGDFLVRRLNGFAWPATFMTTTKKLQDKVKKAYLLPYEGAANRVAVSEFVKDIPMDKSHRSYKTLKTIERELPNLKCPKLILWGGKDFCFNDHFFTQWKNIYPDSFHKYYKDAGHYILEDEAEDVASTIQTFFEG
ncbi:MAG: alpha/beta fold hydrolase [Bacteriovoracaceae bacterium]|nr:alpha/beta fold hydrolase [Bacteriovoracaceae bacterium]